MKKLIAAALAMTFWALSGVSIAAGDPSWSQPNEPYRVVGNVYYVGTEGVGAYLLTSPEGHILIDGATEAGGAVIAANIATLGFKLTDVKYLVNTHAHYDHAGGLAMLKKASGATFLASKGDREMLETGKLVGDNIYEHEVFQAVKVDRVIKDNETIRLGTTALTARLTPGHTRGCTSWTMPVVEAGKSHTIIFYCSTTVAGNVLFGNKAHPNIVADYRRSFRRLKAINADIFLPNHPVFNNLAAKRARQLAGETDAFVSPTELRDYVATSEAAFEAEYAAQKAALRKAKS